MRQEIGFEMLNRVDNRVGSKFAQSTKRDACHILSHVINAFNIGGGSSAIHNTVKHLIQPIGSFAARCAFPAAFMVEELGDFASDPCNINAVINDDERGRTDNCAEFASMLIAHLGIERLIIKRDNWPRTTR